jgi:hypothetical protein
VQITAPKKPNKCILLFIRQYTLEHQKRDETGGSRTSSGAADSRVRRKGAD